MLKPLILSFLLFSFNSFSQMNSNTIGWAMFFNEASTDFSEAFQTEMAQQLMAQFNSLVEIENFAQDKNFMLVVGMTPLKTTYKDGYAFVLVEVICPNSESKTITAYWKARENRLITKVDSITDEDIEFGWCADFDKEFFKSFSVENVISQINGTKLKFKYVAHLELYPDLLITYSFSSEPTEVQLQNIKILLSSNFTEAYISGIGKVEGIYSTMLDFQATEVSKGLKQIEQFILSLNESEIRAIIESVKID